MYHSKYIFFFHNVCLYPKIAILQEPDMAAMLNRHYNEAIQVVLITIINGTCIVLFLDLENDTKIVILNDYEAKTKFYVVAMLNLR